MSENEQDARQSEQATAESDPETQGEPSPNGETDASVEEPLAADDAAIDIEVDDELVERIEASDPEDVAHEVVMLRERVEHLSAIAEEEREQVETLEEKLTRKQAEFQNFKKRMERRAEEERERATEDLVARVVEVRDNLARGLDQEGDIREGVESTLRQFDDVLEAEGVTRIDPKPGETVDPAVHEVLTQVPSDQPEGTVADVHRPGYELGGKVVQTAQVLVSDGSRV